MCKQVTDGNRQEENNNRETLLRPLECQTIKRFVVGLFLIVQVKTWRKMMNQRSPKCPNSEQSWESREILIRDLYRDQKRMESMCVINTEGDSTAKRDPEVPSRKDLELLLLLLSCLKGNWRRNREKQQQE